MPAFRALAVSFLLPGLAAAAFKWFDPTQPGAAPALLSQSGLYANIAAKVLDTAAKPFEVNAALWSDGAAKKRWILLKPGRRIAYDDAADYFDYPDSTVFVKTFLLARAPGDTIHWETRLLVRKAAAASGTAEWHGFSYRWNASQTDAALVSADPAKGLDTLLFVREAGGRRTYRKWRFPSQQDCARCHVVQRKETAHGMVSGRGVLGFFPAQLKRPLPGGGNQVLRLFDQGVFGGTRPGPAQLAARFKGIGEPLPAAPAALRFAALDTAARSYIAANCSGCHGARGEALGVQGEVRLDYDFHTGRPAMEFAMHKVTDFGLNDTLPYDTADVLNAPQGRAAYSLAVKQWGMDTRPGSPWDMALPAAGPAHVLLYPGHASLSALLFRQWARNSPASDSSAVARALRYDLLFGDSAEQARAAQRQPWFFAQPWGSQAWQDGLAAHGLTMDSAIALVDKSGRFYGNDRAQMPPLATFIPDTAAMALLGEWVKGYAAVNAGIRAARPARGAPVLSGRVLRLPAGWDGASVLDVAGRVYPLRPLGGGAYALPERAPAGVLFIRARTSPDGGARVFRLAGGITGS